jgi:pimeloyl-ACP methyl ester carboxylesterase
MEIIEAGAVVAPERTALTAAFPGATSRIVVLIHGLMCSESVWELPGGGDYGSLLARDLGFSPLYLRYNTGLPIADNGAKLATLLGDVVREWPVPVDEVMLLGFSMGGLVSRAATHVASVDALPWLSLVKRALYVGTPHLGAPLERVGRAVTRLLGAIPDPYTRLVADLADLRSDGVKDLGDADLRHADRARRAPTLSLRDARHPVPMLPSIRHYLVAGSLSEDPLLATWFGDVMVPVPSATDGTVAPREGVLPPDHVRVLPGLAHMTLAHHPDVYAHLRAFCEEA